MAEVGEERPAEPRPVPDMSVRLQGEDKPLTRATPDPCAMA